MRSGDVLYHSGEIIAETVTDVAQGVYELGEEAVLLTANAIDEVASTELVSDETLAEKSFVYSALLIGEIHGYDVLAEQVTDAVVESATEFVEAVKSGDPEAIGAALREIGLTILTGGAAKVAMTGKAGKLVTALPGSGNARSAPTVTPRGSCVVPVVRRDAANTVGDLRAAGSNDAHHIIQDAAVRDIPGYDTNAAPGVQLPGPSTAKGTPHYNATRVQRQTGGGSYAAERRIGYKALRRAGLSQDEARLAIQQADAFFRILGVGPETPTRIPGNRL